MSWNPRNMEVIQIFTEKILRKHNVNTSKDFYLKLSLPPHLDLVMQRSGDIVLVGHYKDENNDVGDPVFIFDFNNGNWFPLGFKELSGDTICAYFENGKRKVFPDRIMKFWVLQKRFTRNIREQGWFEKGLMVQSGLVCGVKLIGKDEPNPMKDISEYSKPEE